MKTIRTSLNALALFSTFWLLIFQVGCGIGDVNSCQGRDPDIVTSDLSFVVNAEVVHEEFTDDYDIFYDPADINIQGGTIYFPFYGNGQITEAFFAIRGASIHYRFDLDTLSQDETFYLEVKISNEMPAGCFEVYTKSIGEYGPLVEKYTVRIIRKGGSNTEFFTDKLELHYHIAPEDPDPVYPGDLMQDITPVSGICEDDIDAIREYRYDQYYRFSSDGSFTKMEPGYSRGIDVDNSTCENIIYVEEYDTTRTQGFWSYDHKDKFLELVSIYGYELLVPGTEYRGYDLRMEGDHLRVTLQEDISGPVNPMSKYKEYYLEE